MVKTYQYDAVTNVSTTPDIEDADNATSFEKTGLTNGQRYLFRIDAKAGSTLLASSNEASAMPKAAPAVPAAGPTPTPAPKEGGFTKVAKGFIKFLTGDY